MRSLFGVCAAFVCLFMLLLSGCCGNCTDCSSCGAIPSGVRGRVMKGTGGCGVPACADPVKYNPSPGGKVTVYTVVESSGIEREIKSGEFTADSEGRYQIRLRPGTYHFVADNVMQMRQRVTVTAEVFAELDVIDYVPPP